MIDEEIVLAAIIGWTGFFGTLLGVRLYRIRPIVATLIMIVISYISAAVMMWWDNIGIICVGTIAAISFAPVTYVSALVMRKLGEKDRESHENDP